MLIAADICFSIKTRLILRAVAPPPLGPAIPANAPSDAAESPKARRLKVRLNVLWVLWDPPRLPDALEAPPGEQGATRAVVCSAPARLDPLEATGKLPTRCSAAPLRESLRWKLLVDASTRVAVSDNTPSCRDRCQPVTT